eukprot:3267105-Rhodomonas_salina.1
MSLNLTLLGVGVCLCRESGAEGGARGLHVDAQEPRAPRRRPPVPRRRSPDRHPPPAPHARPRRVGLPVPRAAERAGSRALAPGRSSCDAHADARARLLPRDATAPAAGLPLCPAAHALCAA